jgi:hypothetical protein
VNANQFVSVGVLTRKEKTLATSCVLPMCWKGRDFFESIKASKVRLLLTVVPPGLSIGFPLEVATEKKSLFCRLDDRSFRHVSSYIASTSSKKRSTTAFELILVVDVGSRGFALYSCVHDNQQNVFRTSSCCWDL